MHHHDVMLSFFLLFSPYYTFPLFVFNTSMDDSILADAVRRPSIRRYFCNPVLNTSPPRVCACVRACAHTQNKRWREQSRAAERSGRRRRMSASSDTALFLGEREEEFIKLMSHCHPASGSSGFGSHSCSVTTATCHLDMVLLGGMRVNVQRSCLVTCAYFTEAQGRQTLRQTLKPDKCLMLWFSDAFKVSVTLWVIVCAHAIRCISARRSFLYGTKAHTEWNEYVPVWFPILQERPVSLNGILN